jgi:hypothetical protein
MPRIFASPRKRSPRCFGTDAVDHHQHAAQSNRARVRARGIGAAGAVLKRYDAYAICDEVYEHLVFDGRAHVPLISLPGMRERCVRVGSAGRCSR